MLHTVHQHVYMCQLYGPRALASTPFMAREGVLPSKICLSDMAWTGMLFLTGPVFSSLQGSGERCLDKKMDVKKSFGVFFFRLKVGERG